MSINPISWTCIQAWATMRGIRPLQWEIDAIKGIDTVFIASILADQEKPKS